MGWLQDFGSQLCQFRTLTLFKIDVGIKILPLHTNLRIRPMGLQSSIFSDYPFNIVNGFYPA